MTDLKRALEAEARDAGFAGFGVCRPDAIPEAAGRLAAFLEAGRQGQMSWLTERTQWRGDPAALWPEARSVVMLAEVYPGGEESLDMLALRDRATVSAYARARDYHDVVKKRLKRVGRWLLETVENGGYRDARIGEWVPLSSPAAHAVSPSAIPEIKVFVDTAPVMEKPLAQAAGLGWQGKHTNLLSRELGNWFFLGAIFTTVELEPDPPAREKCGTCTACLDICPTQAFPAPFQLDARRCISYLTIEHKGPVDEALRPALGNRIYGCDDCLAICPWNKFAKQATEMRYAPRPDLISPPLEELAALDDAAFRAKFSGSPIKRIGRDRFVRNVCYAIGNSGTERLKPAVQRLTRDPDTAVADAARWAVGRLT